MPEYITRPGGYDLALQGPYTNRSVNMRVHVLNAKLSALWQTLDRYLNPLAPAHGRYVPLGDRVVVSCVDIAEGRSGDDGLGSVHEVEVAFFIPALYCDPLPRRIVFFAPYLFVNNIWAAVMGREVHGFRKDIATSFASIDVDSAEWSHKARDLTHVEAWAMRRRGADSRLERIRLLDIRPNDDGPALSHDASGLMDALVGSGLTSLSPDLPGRFAHLSDSHALRSKVFGLLTNHAHGAGLTMKLAFLRQFRNPRHSKMTDVQQIVEAESVASISGVPDLIESSEFRFFETASHPIGLELGLPSNQWVRADLSLEVNLDFVFHDAVE